MEASIGQWLSAHGVSAIGVVFALAFLRQLGPAVFKALDAWADRFKNATAHDILIALVRAAEQTFGADQNAEKLDFVAQGAVKAGIDVTGDDIEAAVHEVKAPLKAICGSIDAAVKL